MNNILAKNELKVKLQQIRSLKREIRDDQVRLNKLDAGLGWEKAPPRDAEKSAERYRQKIYEKRIKCIYELNEIQEFINQIKDSRTRRAFEMYYINGWSWQKVAFELGSYSEATPRMMHDRYIDHYVLQDKR